MDNNSNSAEIRKLSAIIKKLNSIVVEASMKNISRQELVELYKMYKYYSKIAYEMLDILINTTQTITKPKMTVDELEQKIQLIETDILKNTTKQKMTVGELEQNMRLIESDICNIEVLVDTIIKLRDEKSFLENDAKVYERDNSESSIAFEDGTICNF